MNPRGKPGSPQRVLELDELILPLIKRRYQIEGCVFGNLQGMLELLTVFDQFGKPPDD